jgi:hypothetical protein
MGILHMQFIFPGATRLLLFFFVLFRKQSFPWDMEAACCVFWKQPVPPPTRFLFSFTRVDILSFVWISKSGRAELRELLPYIRLGEDADHVVVGVGTWVKWEKQGCQHQHVQQNLRQQGKGNGIVGGEYSAPNMNPNHRMTVFCDTKGSQLLYSAIQLYVYEAV